MTRLNGGQRDEGHPNRSVIRERFGRGETLSKAEYDTLNPSGTPLPESGEHENPPDLSEEEEQHYLREHGIIG